MGAVLLKIGIYCLLILWLIAVVMPMVWVFTNSVRSSQEFIDNPFGPPWLIYGAPEPSGGMATPWEQVKENYYKAWTKSQFNRFFVNSLIVTGVSLMGVLGVASMAAYVLARFRFRGNKALFLYFLSGMMIPAQLVLVPLFFQFSYMSDWGSVLTEPFGYSFKLHDSLTGLITIYIALSLPFTILVLTGFFKSLPGELREAGIMDGCGEYRVFWDVMLPLAKPGLVTAAIFNFLGLWNEYLFALVFISKEANKTLPLGLASVSIQAQYKTDFGLMFAGLVIVLVPTLLVYLLLQRQLTSGITVGALKG
jgi:ABC-type glycerol-3-phosphate transport system permease component